MEKINNQKASNFWSGFAFGSVGIGLAVFLFGTKKGRQLLKNLLEISENFEENLLLITEELENELGKNSAPIIEEVLKIASINNEKSEKTGRQNSSSLLSLLNKIRDFSPSQHKNSRKFFVKDKKTV